MNARPTPRRGRAESDHTARVEREEETADGTHRVKADRRPAGRLEVVGNKVFSHAVGAP